MFAIYVYVTLFLPAHSNYTRSVGRKRCPPSDEKWGEGEHCPNAAVFAQNVFGCAAEQVLIYTGRI